MLERFSVSPALERTSPALCSDGAAWGHNGFGQVGDGSTTDRHAPVAVGLASVSAVSAGGFGSLAARTDATVSTWGYNAYGQLGHATTADAHAPTAAPALAGATSAGPVHSLQVLADGSARAWGFGATGALGEGTTDSHPTPVAVDGLAAPGTALATYAYRGDGLRTSKTVAGQTRPFSWDESGPVPLVLSDGALRFVYGPGGRPLYQLDAANVPTYLHQDQLGYTRQLTSATGEVVATFTYGPYGELSSATGTATTPLRFAGEYTDAETGFVYLQARYYDPATGQFLTRDPLVAMTGEPYLYAGGNPLNYTDPLGLIRLRNPLRWNPLPDITRAARDLAHRATTAVGDFVSSPFNIAWTAAGFFIVRPLAVAALAAVGITTGPALLIGVGVATVTWFVAGRIVKRLLPPTREVVDAAAAGRLISNGVLDECENQWI
ncbi:MAG: RHS repeat-associated core domain-containing protein [Actinomycetota bacterium]